MFDGFQQVSDKVHTLPLSPSRRGVIFLTHTVDMANKDEYITYLKIYLNVAITQLNNTMTF